MPGLTALMTGARRATLLLGFAAPLCIAAQGSARAYYVSPSGSDSGPGTAAKPWRSTARVRSAALAPGSQVLFRRGGTWRTQLVVERSGRAGQPIVVGAYGGGAMPRFTASECIKIKGSFVVVTGLHADRCRRAGITVQGDNVTVRGSRATRNMAGIEVDDSSSRARITRNAVINNNRMEVDTPGGHNDHGAFGILLHGDSTVVDHNVIRGSDAHSYDYGRDGAAIEIYGASRNRIIGNIAVDNQTFTELGDRRSTGNVFIANVVRSRLATSTFLITKGGQSGYGPITGTRAYHNTVVLTGGQSQGFVCSSGCTRSILRLRNNIIQARWKVGYADGPVDEDYNLYAGGQAQFRRGAHSRYGNPRFVARASGNFRLLPTSPAVDRGLGGLTTRDQRGRVVPQVGRVGGRVAPDLGAYERTIWSP